MLNLQASPEAALINAGNLPSCCRPFHSAAPRRVNYSRRKQNLTSVLGKADPKDEGTRLLEEDMRRYSQREDMDSGPGPPQANQEDKASEAGVKGLLDKFLIGDFFFVVLALAWLALGVAEKGAFNSSRLLDGWFPLWPLIFQPAIGILMLGSLVSGGLGWLRSRQE